MVYYTTRNVLKGKNSCYGSLAEKKPRRPQPEPYSLELSPRTKHRRKLSETPGSSTSGSSIGTSPSSIAAMASSASGDAVSAADAVSMLLDEFEFGAGDNDAVNVDTDGVMQEDCDIDAVDNLVWPKRREDCTWVTNKVAQGSRAPQRLQELLGLGVGGMRTPSKRRVSAKRMEVDEHVFKDEIVGYGVRASGPICESTVTGADEGALLRAVEMATDKRTNTIAPGIRDQRPPGLDLGPGPGLKAKAKAISLESRISSAMAWATMDRQPLSDITSDRNQVDNKNWNKEGGSDETFDERSEGIDEKPVLALIPTRTIPAGWHRALTNLLNQVEKERDGSSAIRARIVRS